MGLILVSGLASAIFYAAALSVSDWGREWSRFVPWLVLLILAYLGALWGARREIRHGGPGERRVLILLGTGAVLFRLLVLFAPPTLSDDVYRYLWDGKVLLAGVNPYRFPPSAPELEALRDAGWARINHPHLPTIYPPLLMVIFAGSAALGKVAPVVVATVGSMPAEVFLWKVLAAAADLAVGWAILGALRNLGRPAAGAILYLWHPLPILEFAGTGHADVFGVLLVALGFRAWTANRPLSAGVSLTLAGLVKFLPWIALPPLVRRLRARSVLLVLLVVAFYLPFSRHGADALGSLRTYTAIWRANDFLFAFFPGASSSQEPELLAARRLLLALVAGVVLSMTWRRTPWPSVYGWGVGLLFLFSPVVHPWYIIWLLPAAILLFQPAWWLWSLTVFLAYAPLPGFRATGVWRESLALKAVEVLPVLGVAVVQAWWEATRRGAIREGDEGTNRAGENKEGGSPRGGSLRVDHPGWWDRP